MLVKCVMFDLYVSRWFIRGHTFHRHKGTTEDEMLSSGEKLEVVVVDSFVDRNEVQ